VVIFDFFCKLEFSPKDNFFLEILTWGGGGSFLSCRQYDFLLSGTILPIIAGLPCNRNDLKKVGYGHISNCVRRSVWSLGFFLRTGAKVRLRKLVEFRRPDKFRFLKCVYASSLITDSSEIQFRSLFLYWGLVSSAVGCVCLQHIALRNVHLVRRLGYCAFDSHLINSARLSKLLYWSSCLLPFALVTPSPRGAELLSGSV